MPTPKSAPLAGVRVLDFTQVEFGPIATQTLADFGADVIKVERPGTGDIIRGIDGFAAGVEDSAYYLSLNRNKRSICIDLKSDDGKAVVHRLLGEVDVVVENFRPGVMEKYGLGYEQIRDAYPALVYASGTGFGRTGPLSHKGGQDMLAQAMSGVAHHARGDDGRPRLHPISFADFGAGMALVQGILMALLARATTGRGQRVDVTLLDTMLFAQLQELTQWQLRRQETNFERQNLAGIFETNDGYIAVVGLFRPHPLRDICRALDMEDLSARPEFVDLRTQLEHRTDLWPLLDSGFAKFDTAEAVSRLDEVDILCAPVLDHDDVIAHAQVAENESFATVAHPVLGDVTVVRSPVRMSDSPMLCSPPPMLGAHTTDVLSELLGLSEAEVNDLRNSGAIA